MQRLKLYGNKRDSSEPGIFAALRKMGALVHPLDKPVDALVKFRRQIFLIECKSGKKGLTEAQKDFMKDWPVHVLRSAGDAVRFINSIDEIQFRDIE